MKTTVAIALLLVGFTFGVSARTPIGSKTIWQKNHPRIVEVNHRLKNENARINNAVKEGKMSERKAIALKMKVRQIRNEERFMATRHGGHITQRELKILNRQENRINRQIGM